MAHQEFDRFAINMEPLSSRDNKKRIEQDHVPIDQKPKKLAGSAVRVIEELTGRIQAARRIGRPVIVAYGAHAIKNGLALVFIQLMERGWVTHLATNGAGVIHDWEFAFQGKSCEDVGAMVEQGRFGNWEETGFNINLAFNVGAYEGRGYGESVGAMIENQGLQIPSRQELQTVVDQSLASDPQQAAAAADLAYVVDAFDLPPGKLEVTYPWKKFSVQAAAFRLGVPSTGHPMIGHDIIYNHPMNHCASLGRTAQRDFLIYANSVSQLDGGVYISIGSAVMSPMIFEKSLSIAQNLAIQRGERIKNHYILVNDLAESHWDWRQGEPPEDDPAYYLRYNKTFSRMGGAMNYLQADNREFLLTLLQALGPRAV